MKLALGTVQFGLNYGINNSDGKPSREKAFDILKQAYALGIKEIDTADTYGDALDLLGDFHLQNIERFKIFSKFVITSSCLKIEDNLNKSLVRLNLENIDTYFFHRFQDYKNYSNLNVEVNKLKDSGKIKKIGVSLYSNEELRIVLNDKAIEVIQLPFNIFDSDIEKVELLKRCRDRSIEIHIRSLFLQGLFFRNPNLLNKNLKSLKEPLVQLNVIANKYGLSIEELCFSYAKVFPIDCVVIGVDNISQLQKNFQMSKSNIDQSVLQDLKNIKIINKKLLNPSNWER